MRYLDNETDRQTDRQWIKNEIGRTKWDKESETERWTVWDKNKNTGNLSRERERQTDRQTDSE